MRKPCIARGGKCHRTRQTAALSWEARSADEDVMLREQTRMYGSNKFKLGLFGMNCSNGMTMTKAPERWDHSWRNNVTAAKLADEAGLEFVLPIGRWNG